jgi:hypothetical protein
MALNSKAVKVSGGSGGQTASKIKDGYAKGPVPEAMRATKVGKTNKKGYSGPNVAQGSF